jgi:DNA-binding NarL/FixJ family response regulator
VNDPGNVPDIQPPPHGAGQPAARRPRNLSVLCVYENPLFLDRLCRHLEGSDRDIVVEIAVSAEDAFHLMAHVFFDVVVTDCVACDGERNGFIKTIRRKGKETPVIYFARNADAAVLEEAAGLGVVKFLPFGTSPAGPAFGSLALLVRDTARLNPCDPPGP